MVDIFFIILLAIFGYYGFFEAKKMTQKYLADRLAQQKEAEEAIMKSIAEQSANKTEVPTPRMSDSEFTAMLDRLFIPWGRTKGIIR